MLKGYNTLKIDIGSVNMYEPIEAKMNVYDEKGNRIWDEDVYLELENLPRQGDLIKIIDTSYKVKEISHLARFKKEHMELFSKKQQRTSVELYVVKLDEEFLYRSVQTTNLYNQ